eukprot:Skav216666  [mRNA]  locus=scaffold930:87247:92902:- [translate_table: standard]
MAAAPPKARAQEKETLSDAKALERSTSKAGSSGLLVLLAAAAALCMLQSAFVGPSSKPQAVGGGPRMVHTVLEDHGGLAQPLRMLILMDALVMERVLMTHAPISLTTNSAASVGSPKKFLRFVGRVSQEAANLAVAGAVLAAPEAAHARLPEDRRDCAGWAGWAGWAGRAGWAGSSGLLVLLAAAAALCMLQSAFVGPSSKPQAMCGGRRMVHTVLEDHGGLAELLRMLILMDALVMERVLMTHAPMPLTTNSASSVSSPKKILRFVGCPLLHAAERLRWPQLQATGNVWWSKDGAYSS